MSDLWPVLVLLFGFLILGPLVCWLAGMFNPIGYMGVLPLRPEVKEARRQEHEKFNRYRAR